MSGTKSNDDCYFYFYSTCTKGDKCPFRHCEAALGKEVVCPLWKEGQCFRENCQFRHMECKKNRSQIPCYWENQPGGCRKPHCVFLHLRPRSPNRSTFSDVPGAVGYMGATAQQASHLASQQMTGMPPNQTGMDDPGAAMDASNVTQPIEPVVVNFDDQESDTESTPTKQPLRELHSQLDTSLPPAVNFGKDEEVQVKTLEQIRLERIHKESPNFYETTPGESVETEQDKPSVDLRKHLKRKLANAPIPEFLGHETSKRFVKLKFPEVHEDANFRIKTLDEIRQEKERKKMNEKSFEGADLSPGENKSFEEEKTSKENSSSKKRRINRLVKLVTNTPLNTEVEKSKKENVAENGNVSTIVDEPQTDVLSHLSAIRKRIIKRKLDGSRDAETVVEKKNKSIENEEDNLVSDAADQSNGASAVSTIHNQQELRPEFSSSFDSLRNDSSRERTSPSSVTTPEEKTESKAQFVRKLREDRTVSQASAEEDLDLFLDDDYEEDVPEDKTDDVLLQELEEIINS